MKVRLFKTPHPDDKGEEIHIPQIAGTPHLIIQNKNEYYLWNPARIQEDGLNPYYRIEKEIIWEVRDAGPEIGVDLPL